MRIDNKIMMRFPEIELSYGQIDHTKVCYDLYSIIPCGKKFFAWFTYYKGQCVCIIIDAKTRTITEVCTAIFDSSLSLFMVHLSHTIKINFSFPKIYAIIKIR